MEGKWLSRYLEQSITKPEKTLPVILSTENLAQHKK